jgi:photosystem II stability/assembly factor-like uncharacterized protein
MRQHRFGSGLGSDREPCFESGFGSHFGTDFASRARAAARAGRIACIVVGVLAVAGAARAVVWTSAGPTGGIVKALAVDPSDPQRVYAGTNGGGFFRSLDGGLSWSAINEGVAAPATFMVTAISVDPLDPSRVYASVHNGPEGGVFRSVDGGASWSFEDLGAPVYAVAAAGNPLAPDTVYAGVGNLLYRSSDGGTSWTAVSETGYYPSITVDPTDPRTVYAGGTRHVRKSIDGGATWVTKSAGLPPFEDVESIVVDPSAPNVLYAGISDSGVYKSNDGGETWTPIGPLVGTNALSVTALALDPSDPDTIFAAGFAAAVGGIGVYRSTNGGASWATTPLPLTTRSLAFAPSAPGRLLAGTGEGIWRSDDGAVSWLAANAGLTNVAVRTLAVGTNGFVFAGSTTGKVFRSTSGGASWDPLATHVFGEEVYSLAVDPTNPAVLYAGSIGTQGIKKSSDGGATWSPLNTGAAPINGYALAIDSTNPDIVYAGAFGGVYRSTQGGHDWNSVSNGVPPFVISLVIDPAAPSTLYAGTDPIAGGFQGVYKTTNSGGQWVPVNTGLPSVAGAAVQALVIDPASGAIYAGLEDLGVYKSTNGGASWDAANEGLTHLDVTSLRVDPVLPDTVYAGTRGGGVFRSVDGGAQWEAIDEGMHNPSVEALAVAGAGRPLAGTGGGGVFFVPACADEQDNDGDGAIDHDGGPAQGPPDPQCTTPLRNHEAPSCGLGGEMVVGLWLLGSLLSAVRRGRAAMVGLRA